MSHVTRRQGNPYTLILKKLPALFTQEAKRRTERATLRGPAERARWAIDLLNEGAKEWTVGATAKPDCQSAVIDRGGSYAGTAKATGGGSGGSSPPYCGVRFPCSS